jgi:RsiW-degrading membrane proteinase PrsW (M82 family)
MNNSKRPGINEPRSLVFWTLIVLIVFGFYLEMTRTFKLFGDYTDGIATSTIVWVVYGAVIGWLIYRQQLFEHRPVSAAIAVFVWGGFVAGGVTGVATEDLQSIADKLLGFELSREWGPAFRAPFIEETMKWLGVVTLALIPRVRLARVADGLFYGMISGLGFLVFENIFFSNQAILATSGQDIGDGILGVMLIRGIISLPLSHVVFTGIAGAGIGFFVSRSGQSMVKRIAVAIGLLATAFLLHGFQNSPLLDSISGSIFLKGLPALVIFLLVLRWARSEYRTDLRSIASELPAITNEDFDALATKRRRGKAAKALENAQQARTIQHAQIDLIVTADIYGVDAPETQKATQTLASLSGSQDSAEA